jgi:hypothetical protein
VIPIGHFVLVVCDEFDSVVDAVCGDNRREVKTGCVLKRSRVSGAKRELASEAANSACQTSPEVLFPCRVLGNVDPALEAQICRRIDPLVNRTVRRLAILRLTSTNSFLAKTGLQP